MDILLSQAIDGFLLDKEVSGASPYTIRNYRLDIARFVDYLAPKDPVIRKVVPNDVRGFIKYLQTTRFAPDGVAPRPVQQLSPKTIRNAHTTLSSLWTWAIEEGYADQHVVRMVRPPKPQDSEIIPLTEDEVRALMVVAGRSSVPYILRLRDKAILLFFTDTGVRVSELCDLLVCDVDLKLGTAQVVGKSRLNSGQGKMRMVHFGTRTRKALWQYLTKREAEPDEPLFTTINDGEIDRRHLGTHLRRMGERAEVKGVHPHRFRHTFAINYLRNDGDIYTLQKLMGHTTLEMVKRYLAIAQADCEEAHRKASPVDNWKL